MLEKSLYMSNMKGTIDVLPQDTRDTHVPICLFLFKHTAQ